ncbi:MAG TPA: hypothetical protein VFW66_04145 [Gemmatimonadales bacterium]|nr:hypothetical protein [Gemmatimonadales bacterium]
MSARTWTIALAIAALAACSDTTGPDLSTGASQAGSSGGTVVVPPGAHPVAAK